MYPQKLLLLTELTEKNDGVCDCQNEAEDRNVNTTKIGYFLR